MHLAPQPQVDVVEDRTLVSDVEEQVHVLWTILYLLELLELTHDHALKQDTNK